MLAAVNVSSPLTKGGRWSASPAALLIALVAALATLASPATGLARPGTHNFRLELNGAAMVADQSDRFDFGGGGGVAYGLGVLPFLEIQAGYRADFLRATSATSENGYGAFHGLGLALAARIAHAHGGELRYQPREGGGSCFLLEIPKATSTPEILPTQPSIGAS